jgi:phosphoglycolate phosphatase-like HAD superfamily hydrolase
MMNRTQGRAWDEFDTYLLDIDGTLIHCTDATHYFAFCDALKTLSGRDLTLEGVTAHGNVDAGILRDALVLACVAESEWRPRLPAISATMCDFVETRKAELCSTVLPRVAQVLEHLRSRGAKLGIATGNLERIGRLKLENAGLMRYFDFGGWSDGYEFRSDVFRAAVAKARNLCGAEAAVCVVGDTPADVKAAHDNELPVIAVATGVYSIDQLRLEKPEWCVASLEELQFAPADQ